MKNIHENREIDELALQPDAGDVGNPDLVGTLDFQVPDEVGIAWERMPAVGGAWLARRRSATQAEFVHPTADTFTVHGPAEASHHDGQAPVAEGGPLAGQVDQGGLEHGLVDGRPRRVINRTAWHAEQPAEKADRVGVGQLHDDLPFLLAGPFGSRDAFLGFRVRRPDGRGVVRVRRCGFGPDHGERRPRRGGAAARGRSLSNARGAAA